MKPSFDLRGALPLLSSLFIACSGDGAGSAASAPSVWITEAEYQFGDAPERDVLFADVHLRVDSLQDRVLVLDTQHSQVSAWTPRGSILFVMGRRATTFGEFDFLSALFVEAGGFSVLHRYGTGVAHYTASGELERIAQGPAWRVRFEGLDLKLFSVKGGTYLGLPWIMPEAEVGVAGARPFSRQPLLRVRSAGENRWHDPDPLLWLDFTNRALAVQLPDGDRVFTAQPFGDADQVRFEPDRAVVMRLKDGPGAVELIEVDAQGDTVWHRRLQFEPRTLTGQMIDDYVERHVQALAPGLEQRASPEELRQLYHDVLYKPEYLPAADRLFLTASGEVWLRTMEKSDTLRMHYAVRRGDAEGEPRRVLLPEWLSIQDATDTHVWGIRYARGKPQVVGRRLVPVRE